MPPRPATHNIAATVKVIKRRERLGQKRNPALAALKELGAHLVLPKVHERLGAYRCELTSKHLGVGGPHLEGYKRAAIADNGIADRIIELVEILVRKHKRKMVLAYLGKRACKSARREIMKLVDVQVEVHAG